MNDFYQIKNPMWHNPNQMFPGMNMPFNNINLKPEWYSIGKSYQQLESDVSRDEHTI